MVPELKVCLVKYFQWATLDISYHSHQINKGHVYHLHWCTGEAGGLTGPNTS